jgi:hypothetical protein
LYFTLFIRLINDGAYLPSIFLRIVVEPFRQQPKKTLKSVLFAVHIRAYEIAACSTQYVQLSKLLLKRTAREKNGYEIIWLF